MGETDRNNTRNIRTITITATTVTYLLGNSEGGNVCVRRSRYCTEGGGVGGAENFKYYISPPVVKIREILTVSSYDSHSAMMPRRLTVSCLVIS